MGGLNIGKLASVAVIFLSLLSVNLSAGPARRGEFSVTQPDGSTFMAVLRGDEFMKIFTTASGQAIKQEIDGWYYYAYYDADGSKKATEWKVGSQAPADVLAASARIPYDLIRSKALQKRAEAGNIEQGPSSAFQRLLAKRAGLRDTKTAILEKYRALVILVAFADEPFSYTMEDFSNMLSQEGYSRDGATGSAKDYFNYQFKGLTEFEFDVTQVVTLSQPYAYYGENDLDGMDIRAAEMIAEACELADQYVDYSQYDLDNDGFVDNVYIFYAGGDEAVGAGDNRIWAHSWDIFDGAGVTLTLDGKQIGRYACSSELSSTFGGSTIATIGTFCHEFSHVLGLMDLYDTDYDLSGGQSEPMWYSTTLMDGGNFNNSGRTPPNYNAVDRCTFDAMPPEFITVPGTYELESIGETGRYYRIDTDVENEFYLLEYRDNTLWDEYIGGSGMLIYHVDKSENPAGRSYSYNQELTAQQRWDYNEVNCYPGHQCAYIVTANPDAGYVSEIFYPSGGFNSFTPETRPAFVFWSGASSSLAITNIVDNGNTVTFDVVEVLEEGEIPQAVLSSVEEYQDAVIIQWQQSAISEEMKAYATLYSGDTELDTIEAEAYDEGRFSAIFEGLTPGAVYTVDLYFSNGAQAGEKLHTEFTTKNLREDGHPFIYMKYVNESKAEDGSFPVGTGFPLRLFNATDAVEINWFYDSEPVVPGASGYFIPENSGTMKAVATYRDGGTEVIIKEIVIR